MSANTILPEVAPLCADDAGSVEEFITRETEALQLELFGSIYALDWPTAWNWAASMLPDVLVYAAQWDADVAVQRAEQAPAVTIGSRWVVYRAGQPYEVVVLDIDRDHQDALAEGCGLYGWVPLAELTEPSPYAQEATNVAQ